MQRESVERIDTLKRNYLRTYGLGSSLGGFSVHNFTQRQSNKFVTNGSNVSSTRIRCGPYDKTIIGDSRAHYRGSNSSFIRKT